MSQSKQRRHHAPSWLVIAALAVALPLGLYGQGGQGQGGRGGGAGAGRGAAPAAGAPAVPGGAAAAPAGQGRGGPAAGGGGGAGARGQAPVDVTGYWVSMVDEDYIERMFPDSPRSGVPRGGGGGGGGIGNGAAGGRGGGGRGAGAAGAAADPCRAYGAGGSMRLPGRLHITWQDDNTLKVEMDSGTQTRLLHFGGTPPPSSEKSLQGYSVATWEIGGGGRGGRGGGGGGGAPALRWGSLNVVTTNLTGGYLLTSRSSYSETAVLTEYFQRHSEFGNDYMTVVAAVGEPGGRATTTSSTFKKEPDGSKFSPSGCTVVR